MLRNLLSLVLLLIALPATALAQAPRNAPGTLISADPVAGAPETMRSWRIAYWTSDAGGRAIRVTGRTPNHRPTRRAR